MHALNSSEMDARHISEDEDNHFTATIDLETSSDESLTDNSTDHVILGQKTGLGAQDGPRDSDSYGPQQGLLPRDKQRKTAYYNYVTEKQMSHEEAKLFYQQSQKEAYGGYPDGLGPVVRAQTFPPTINGNLDGPSQMSSVQSRHSNHSYIQGSHPLLSALNIGSNTFEKQPNTAKIPSHEPEDVEGQNSNINTPTQTRFSQPDISAKDRSLHLEPPLDATTSSQTRGMIDDQNATISLDGNIAEFSGNAQIESELSDIYKNIQKVLDVRRNYIRLSLQGPGDNPKDDPGWTIYPPPPEPVWDEDKERPGGQRRTKDKIDRPIPEGHSQATQTVKEPTSSSNCAVRNTLPQNQGIVRVRKAGQNIGEDFEMSDLLPLPEASEMTFLLDNNGVYQVYENIKSSELDIPIVNVPTIRDFYIDLDQLLSISSDGPTKSFAFRRLKYLEGKYNLYALLHEYQEVAETKKVPHRDFYNVRKVDTHVHHSACMNQKHLLRFIKSKMKRCPDEVVMFRDGKRLTLKEVFESINLTAYDLSIDTLDMHVSSEATRVSGLRKTDSHSGSY